MDPLDKFDMTTKKNIQKWLQAPFDQDTQSAVKLLLKQHPDEAHDAFHSCLTFGTAGLRSVMGLGTNRLNIYTIREATQGLSDYINLYTHHDTPSVVIGYDSRHNSKLFAEETARVLAGNHIKALLAEDIIPTPFVSFACRYTHCIAAIMITASHNPPEYNGYKVYWSDGAQIVSPHDSGILHHIQKVQKEGGIEISSLNDPLIEPIQKKIFDAYLDEIEKLQNYPKQNALHGASLKIVYSPLHGTGRKLLPKALERWGMTSLTFVEEQMKPDGNFPTVKSANPEMPETLKMGSDQMLATSADLFIATDPDADRLGVVINHQNKAHILNGNQLATLMLYHLLKTYQDQHRLSSHLAVVSTIVTTRLLTKMCDHFKVKYFDALTGFKYIGEKIRQWEEDPDQIEFLFGAEESLGYLYGTYARDKDALIASCVLVEAALCQKLKGKTLIDLLHEIYKQFGLFREKQLSINLEFGAETMLKMKTIMTTLRNAPPKTLHGMSITSIDDYLSSSSFNCKTAKRTPLMLPQSDVLTFHFEDKSTLVIRPSGTEPKIKFYAMMQSSDASNLSKTQKLLDDSLDLLLQEAKTYFLSL